MSSTTILELRQIESPEDPEILPDGSQQNGVWTNTLREPILMTEGMQISVKSCFLDTSAAASGYIEVEQDIDVSMTAALYLNNYNVDQFHDFALAFNGSLAGSHRLREYGGGVAPSATNATGDNNKWFLAEVSESQGIIFNIPQIELTPLGKEYNNGRCGGTFPFEYTGAEPGAIPYGEKFHLIIDSRKARIIVKNNPYKFGVRCLGTTTPQCRMVSGFNYRALGLESYKFVGATTQGAGTVIVTPQLVTTTFTIPGGQGVVYSPLEMSQLITDKMNNSEVLGDVSIDYSAAGPTLNNMTKYPVMSPFLTTVLKNDQELQARSTTEGVPIAQVFVNASGYEAVPDGADTINENGDNYFFYPIARMLWERGQETAALMVRPAVDRWVGANQIQMSFDEVENKLKFDIQHFPIYGGESTAATANDGKPSAIYNPATDDGLLKPTSGLALQYGGIVWTDLSPAPFWNNTLGFSNAITPPTPQGRLSYDGGAIPPVGTTNSFEIPTKDGVNSTGAFPGLDLGVIHNSGTSTGSIGYNVPLYELPGAVTKQVTRETDDTSSIFSTRTWNSAIADEGYFLLDIGTNFTQNMVGSALTSHNTQSIINRYYTANSFTSDQGAGSIVYTHRGEPQMLSEFSVAVRNPDRSLISNHILQEKNSVFMEVMTP